MQPVRPTPLKQGTLFGFDDLSIHSDEPATLTSDELIVQKVRAGILSRAGGELKLAKEFGILIRKLLDWVIDTPETGRLTISELEKTEKTYIGTRVEMSFRNHLKLPKGKILDLLVDGIEADIKNTIADNWAIPHEAIDRPCVLIQLDEKRAVFSVGLFIAHDGFLNPGRNQDGKRTLSRVGRGNIRWLAKDAPYPPNFWERLDRQTRNHILSAEGGTERIVRLFRCVQRVPIARGIVAAVARQDDFMKRIRFNGGARDFLAPEQIAILWGGKDSDLIQALGLPLCSDGEFISVKPDFPEHFVLLQKRGHISTP